MRALRKEAVTEVNVPDTLSKSFPSAQFVNMLKSSCDSDHISHAVNFNLKFVEGVTSVSSVVTSVTCLMSRDASQDVHGYVLPVNIYKSHMPAVYYQLSSIQRI